MNKHDITKKPQRVLTSEELKMLRQEGVEVRKALEEKSKKLGPKSIEARLRDLERRLSILEMRGRRR